MTVHEKPRGARELASANSTSAAFLGGQQRSWMNGGHTFAPPSRSKVAQTRPNRPPVASAISVLPLTSTPSTSSITATTRGPEHPALPASTSTSPELANTVPSSEKAPNNTAHNQFLSDKGPPSPALTEDPHRRGSLSEQDPIAEVSGSLFERPTRPPTETRLEQSEGGAHSPGMAQAQQGQQSNGSLKDSRIQFRLPYLNTSRPSPSLFNNATPGARTPDARQAPNHVGAASGQNPSPITPPEQAISSLNHSSPPVTTGPAPYIPASNHIQTLQNFVNGSGGTRQLSPVVYGRIHLLQDAVKSDDWLFLKVHQYMAMDSAGLLPPIAQGKQHIAIGFKILSDPLVSNSAIDPAIVRFFASFPILDAYLEKNSPDAYRGSFTTMSQAFHTLSLKWTPMIQHWVQRGVPPVPREIQVELLSGASIVLELLIFRHVLRLIWGSRPEAGIMEPAEYIFKVNRQIITDLLARPDPSTSTRVQRQDEATFGEFQRLIHGRLQNFHDPSALVSRQPHSGPPSVPSQTSSPALPPGQILPSNSPHPRAPLHHSEPCPVAVSPNVPQPMHRQTLNPSPVGIHYQSAGFQQNRNSRPSSHLSNSSRPGAIPSDVPRQGDLYFPRPSETPAHLRVPNPRVYAIHQLDLQSPTLKSAMPSPSGKTEKLYRYVADFAINPVPFPLSSPTHHFTFQISTDEFKNIPRQIQARGQKAVREVHSESVSFRMRCVKVPTSRQNMGPSAWAVADTTWPSFAVWQINGKRLEERLKLHHGKDLPIDLNDFLKQGSNSLSLFINNVSQQHSDDKFKYILAVEKIAFRSHEALLQAIPAKSTIPAEESQASMLKAHFKPAADDEIEVVSSNITIPLRDPHTYSVIFKIPVRGRNCHHRACFDLETFLNLMRPADSMGSLNVTRVDGWRCPYCGCDVRPKSLVVDGFLVAVRAKLEEQGLLETREIVVEQDGNWRPKPEEDSRDGSSTPAGIHKRAASAHAEEPSVKKSNKSSSTPTEARRVAEIVVLDD